jgi:hypothetical protein
LASDIDALDAFIHRCKLGPFRPSRAAMLERESKNALRAEDRAQAFAELSRLRAGARVELEKLRLIQQRRLSQQNSETGRTIQFTASKGKERRRSW